MLVLNIPDHNLTAAVTFSGNGALQYHDFRDFHGSQAPPTSILLKKHNGETKFHEIRLENRRYRFQHVRNYVLWCIIAK